MSYSEKKLEALLLGMLYLLGNRTYRTKLVKMTYLIDEAHFRLCGHTITGLDYIWDNYGPNAESNEIVATLDDLVCDGSITELVGSTPTGTLTYGYKLEDDLDTDAASLTGDEWLAVRSVVEKYRRTNAAGVTRASKRTEPFRTAVKTAVKGSKLHFCQDMSLTISEDKIQGDPFLKETVEAIRNDSGRRVSLEELREGIA